MEERVKKVLGTIETEEIGNNTNLILAGAMVTKDHYLDRKYEIVEKGTPVIQEILKEKTK